MFKNIRLSRYCFAMLSLLLSMVQGFAQIGLDFSVGESGQFEVKPVQGNSYCWKVTTNLDREKGAEEDKVIYLTKNCSPMIRLKWEKAGIYFLTVTAFNQNGCSNSKTYQVYVTDNHKPVANDDYASTHWLKSIQIDLLRNDRDAYNDLDSSSLKILTKAEYGEVTPGKTGSITYVPLRNQTGTDRFFYRICDACNQCDTAMVSIGLNAPPLYLPQGISPNGDNINDRFVISGLDAYPKSSLTIFSRDGIVIYYSSDYKNDWSGCQDGQMYRSRPVPDGTYYYLLHLGGTKRIIKGYIFIAK